MNEIAAGKFEILDRIHAAGSSDFGVPLTVSIGLAQIDGALSEKENAAKISLQLALQRGGGFFLGGAGVCQGGDGRQDGVPDLELDGLVRCRIGVGDDMQPDQLPRQRLLPLHQCQRRKQRQGDGK